MECKAADKIKTANFKKDIDNLCQYKEGVTKALRQIYGEKKVKFVRVKVENQGVLPNWHPYAGEKAWIMVDEVSVE